MRYFAERAWLPAGIAADVLIEIEDGRFAAVTPGAGPGGARRLPGLVLPGLANAHSHAFHRALRGRTSGTDFWAWRQGMYAVAARLDPDAYLALARATYAEMALAGITAVGEFHYLHHGPGGVAYADPNAMGLALAEAARDAGIRLTLLDTCYLAGGLGPTGHRPLDRTQRRFSDGTAAGWAERVAALRDAPGLRVGAAIHSIRAVPAADLPTIAAFARSAPPPGARPLHVHLSEQPAENEACRAFYGVTPTRLLDDAGVLGPGTTVVHATHLEPDDLARLGRTRTTACLCPTTEQDLADGIGPARALADAGAPLALGSDQHATIDLLGEARALETHERLRTRRRGHFTPPELLAALTRHASIGWADAGRIAPGDRADLVAVRTDTVRTAGVRADQLLLSATAADVDTVVVDGREIVTAGRHHLGDVPTLLTAATATLT